MWDIRTILHPTDLSEGCEPALAVARALARDRGARLILLHVAPPIGAFGIEAGVPPDPRYNRAPLDALRGRVEGPDLKYPLEYRLAEGDAVSEILRAADVLKADLIVMGTHGRRGLRRALMGSVAEAVLRRADCPVMVVKPAGVEVDASAQPQAESPKSNGGR
jgi:universal stress protein A